METVALCPSTWKGFILRELKPFKYSASIKRWDHNINLTHSLQSFKTFPDTEKQERLQSLSLTWEREGTHKQGNWAVGKGKWGCWSGDTSPCRNLSRRPHWELSFPWGWTLFPAATATVGTCCGGTPLLVGCCGGCWGLCGVWGAFPHTRQQLRVGLCGVWKEFCVQWTRNRHKGVSDGSCKHCNLLNNHRL